MPLAGSNRHRKAENGLGVARANCMRSLRRLTRIFHEREAVGPGRRKGGALAPPQSGRPSSFSLASRAVRRRTDCTGGEGGTISGPCKGGAKAPPFPIMVRNPH